MKNILILFFGITKLALVISATDVEKYRCFVPGECTEGYHVDFKWAKDQNQCLDLCNKAFLCRWFTFYPSSLTCQHFVTCGTIETECVRIVSPDKKAVSRLHHFAFSVAVSCVMLSRLSKVSQEKMIA